MKRSLLKAKFKKGLGEYRTPNEFLALLLIERETDFKSTRANLFAFDNKFLNFFSLPVYLIGKSIYLIIFDRSDEI